MKYTSCFYVLVDDTRVNNKKCYNEVYGDYGTLSEAKTACNADTNCAAVYDQGCDGSHNYKLCPNGYSETTSTDGSCLYKKEPKCK